MFTLIAVVVTIFALIQLWLTLQLRGWWWLKLTLPVLTVYLTTQIAFSFPTVMGFPTTATLPDEGVISHVEVREPVPNRPGAIYVLVHGRFGDKPTAWNLFAFANPERHPRFFVLPYTAQSQKDFEKVAQELKKGRRAVLRGKKKREGESEQSGENQRSANQSESTVEHDDPRPNIEFEDIGRLFTK